MKVSYHYFRLNLNYKLTLISEMEEVLLAQVGWRDYFFEIVTKREFVVLDSSQNMVEVQEVNTGKKYCWPMYTKVIKGREI